MWRCGVADTSGAVYLRPLALPVALCFKTFMGGRVIKRCNMVKRMLRYTRLKVRYETATALLQAGCEFTGAQR